MPEQHLSVAGSHGQLADGILKAFYQACDVGNCIAANHLINAVESIFLREIEVHPERRRERRVVVTELKLHLMLTPNLGSIDY